MRELLQRSWLFNVNGIRCKIETHNPDDWEPQSHEDAATVSSAAWEEARKWRFNPPRSRRYLYQMSKFKEYLEENKLNWYDARKCYPSYVSDY